MDNPEIRRTQLRRRDSLAHIQAIEKSIEKREKELSSLQESLIEAKRELAALDELLVGKVYVNNT